MQFYVFEHALIDNLGGLCDPRYNGTLMDEGGLMEFLLQYGVTERNQTRDFLVQQSYPVVGDTSLLESFWSSVCVCIKREEQKAQGNELSKLMFEVVILWKHCFVFACIVDNVFFLLV